VLVEVGEVTRVGSRQARLVVGRERGRQLLLDGEPAFDLSFWCGTCPYLFERLGGANQALGLPELADRLTEGLDAIDETVVRTYGSLLAEGDVLPLLLEIRPRLRRPVETGDYFAEDSVATWGIDGFWGLPLNPRTPYYRTYETTIDATAHLYEHVVPMVPPSWNDRATVAAHAERLATSSRPTAVAFSTLDVCVPAVARDGADWHHHWGLTHFLLDGHHKVEAAATTGRPLRLLALVSIDGSLAEADQVRALTTIRATAAAPRRDRQEGRRRPGP
jgi:hypothetical protein